MNWLTMQAHDLKVREFSRGPKGHINARSSYSGSKTQDNGEFQKLWFEGSLLILSWCTISRSSHEHPSTYREPRKQKKVIHG